MLIFLLIVCILFGVVVYGLFATGMLSGESQGFDIGWPPRLRELPPGCLVTLIVVGSLWFIAWGIVLILAIKLLRTPLNS